VTALLPTDEIPIMPLPWPVTLPIEVTLTAPAPLLKASIPRVVAPAAVEMLPVDVTVYRAIALGGNPAVPLPAVAMLPPRLCVMAPVVSADLEDTNSVRAVARGGGRLPVEVTVTAPGHCLALRDKESRAPGCRWWRYCPVEVTVTAPASLLPE